MAQMTRTLLNAVGATGAGTAYRLPGAPWSVSVAMTGTATVDIEASNDGTTYRRLGERIGATATLWSDELYRWIRANVITRDSGTITATAWCDASNALEGWGVI